MFRLNTLLIVEDDAVFGDILATKFSALGWTTTKTNTLFEAENWVDQTTTLTHCLLDLNIQNQSSLGLIPKLLASFPDCKIVVLTGFASVQTSIEAVKLGAAYLLSKPCSIQDILKAFEHSPDPQHIRLDTHAKSGMDDLEWETIQRVLKDNDFNISKTADHLGMHRRTLQRKLKKRL